MTYLHRAVISFLAIVMTATGLVAVSTPAQARTACTASTYFVLFGWIDDAGFRAPTVGWQSGNLGCELWQGTYSAGVHALQRNLNKCYGAGIAEDWSFGPRTRDALKAAQRRIGTYPDGIYGRDTRRKMSWYVPAFGTCMKALRDS